MRPLRTSRRRSAIASDWGDGPLPLRLEELRLIATGTWERIEAQGFRVREAQKILEISHVDPRVLRKALQRQIVVIMGVGATPTMLHTHQAWALAAIEAHW